ncbi:MAG: HDOD domain-containing protein [Candidatus Zixiibacteriota bacterium]
MLTTSGTKSRVQMQVQTQTQQPLRERVIATLGEFLPARAAVIPTVMRMTGSGNAGAAELARVLSKDPSLSATVLRLSNSSFYGRKGAVTSLNEAIMVLGFSLLRSLVVATSVSSLFRKDEERGLEQALWDHSIAVAIGARIIYERVEPRRVEEAFLAGLLHDLAQLVLLQKFPEEYMPALDEISRDPFGERDIEQEYFGFHHADLGATMLQHWNFPPRLVKAVRMHHHPTDLESPDATDIVEPALLSLTHAVCLADTLAKSLGYWFSSRAETDLVNLPSTQFFNFTPETMAHIADALAARFSEEQKLFNG